MFSFYIYFLKFQPFARVHVKMVEPARTQIRALAQHNGLEQLVLRQFVAHLVCRVGRAPAPTYVRALRVGLGRFAKLVS